MLPTINDETLDRIKIFEQESPLVSLFRADYFAESLAFFMEAFKNEAVNRCSEFEFQEKLEIYLHDVSIYSGETLLQRRNNCIDEWEKKKCIEFEIDDNTKKHYYILNSHIRQFIASFYRYNSTFYSNAETSMARIDTLLESIVLDMEEDQEIRKANEIQRLEDEIAERQKEIDRLKDPNNLVEAKKDVIDNFNEIRGISDNLNSLYAEQKKGIKNIIKNINGELHKNERRPLAIFQEAFDKADQARNQNGFLQAYQNMQSYTEEARMHLFKARCKKIVFHAKIVELLESEGVNPIDFELFSSINATVRNLISGDEYLNKEFDKIITDIETGREAKIQALYALHKTVLENSLEDESLFEKLFEQIVISNPCPNEFMIRDSQISIEKVAPISVSKNELELAIQKQREAHKNSLDENILTKHISDITAKLQEVSMQDIIGLETQYGFAEYKLVEKHLNKQAQPLPALENCTFSWQIDEYTTKTFTLPNLRWRVRHD